MSKIKIFALGGLNEIGKNMYVVEVNNDIFIFDAGLKYPDNKMFGIDYIIPDFDYIVKNKKRIKGIFLTNSHAENIGAIYDILSEVKDIKVYATKFTCLIIKQKLNELKLKFDNLVEIKPHIKLNFKENSIFPISVTHSSPDSVLYVLNTRDGSIVYTGNFVFDSMSSNNYSMDIGKIAYVGKQNVLCLLSESIYAGKSDYTAPKHRAYSYIKNILDKSSNRVIFSVYDEQIYRIQELFNAISKTNRRIVIMGKPLQTLINTCISEGYLTIAPDKIGDLTNIDDTNIVILTYNDRNNIFNNIKKIVSGYDKFLKLKETDEVVFLEQISENNDKLFVNLLNDIACLDVLTHYNKQLLSHHASNEDLAMFSNLLNPKYYMPVNGEYKDLVENANALHNTGFNKENIILKLNGEAVSFVKGNLVVDKKENVKVDEILIDGTSSEDVGELVLKDREILSDNGIVIVTSVINKITKEIIGGPEILTRGFVFVKENTNLITEATSMSTDIITSNIVDNKVDFNKIKNGIRDQLSKYFYSQTGCRPMIITVIQEI